MSITRHHLDFPYQHPVSGHAAWVEHRQALEQGTPLASYLAVTVDCPDERDAWRVHSLLTPRLEGGAVRAVEISSEPVRLATDPAAPTPPEAASRSGSGARR